MGKTKKTDRLHTAAEYRGELVKRGWTISAWARKHGYHTSTVFEAIRGTRSGPLSKTIIAQLNKEIEA